MVEFILFYNLNIFKFLFNPFQNTMSDIKLYTKIILGSILNIEVKIKFVYYF